MARTKLNIWNRAVLFVIVFCRMVVTKMTDNAIYETPDPTLKDVGTAIDALDVAYQDALKGGTDLKEIQYIKYYDLMGMMSKLADYVQTASKGDAEAILSAGMEVRNERSKGTVPPVPEKLRFKNNNNTGEASLMWKGVRTKQIYILQQTVTVEDDSSWLQVSISTSPRALVLNLPSGKNSWFRVAAQNAHGHSGWSDAAKKMIG